MCLITYKVNKGRLRDQHDKSTGAGWNVFSGNGGFFIYF